VIEPGDQLVTKIGTKDLDRKSKQITFIKVCITVENVICEDTTVQIRGRDHSTDASQSDRTSVWLTNESTFCLRKQCWSEEAIQTLKKQNVNLIATDLDLLAFEENVFYAIDNGAVKTLICTANIIEKQSKENKIF
jgi:stalled ribosome rescue protein Dom34